ncbi:hypothetical protein QUA81_03120 [Microcoleus sp. F6_B4]
MKGISRIQVGVKLKPAFSLLFEMPGRSKAEILLLWIDKLGLGESRSRSSQRQDVIGDRKNSKIIAFKIFLSFRLLPSALQPAVLV